MAKKCMINRDLKRRKMSSALRNRRQALKSVIHNRELSDEERFNAVMKLDKLPKNASPVRVHNRCEITGRPKGFYRKFRVSRIALREMASNGQLPGMTKSSW